jgi:hypothetical protein
MQNAVLTSGPRLGHTPAANAEGERPEVPLSGPEIIIYLFLTRGNKSQQYTVFRKYSQKKDLRRFTSMEIGFTTNYTHHFREWQIFS